MFLHSAALLLCASSAVGVVAFQAAPAAMARPRKSLAPLGITMDAKGALDQIRQIIASENYPDEDPAFDKIVKTAFPGAMSNKALESKVVEILAQRGFSGSNTLLCTSLCCDELARVLEDDLGQVYGKNFFLGGLVRSLKVLYCFTTFLCSMH
jgi:Limiting CO2-inducible proteins B/C beta carbonyic anhydrases